MASSSKRSQTARLAKVNKASAGVQKYFASTPSLVMAGATRTPAEVESALGSYAPALTALSLLRGQLHTAVTGERALATQIDQLLSELEVCVVNQFGPRSEQVVEFGYSPKKTPVLSAAAKATATAKSKATRAAKKAALTALTAGPQASPTPAAAAAAPQPATNGTPAKA